LLFTKGGRTDQVWFYDVQDDGFSLDDKRDRLYDADFAGDLPKIVDVWGARDKTIAGTATNDRATASFWVSRDEIAANKYDLSINRYKEVTYEEASYDPPGEILARMRALESEILADMDELQVMLGQPPTNPVE
jgi:type I restriction enzyme M protein